MTKTPPDTPPAPPPRRRPAKNRLGAADLAAERRAEAGLTPPRAADPPEQDAPVPLAPLNPQATASQSEREPETAPTVGSEGRGRGGDGGGESPAPGYSDRRQALATLALAVRGALPAAFDEHDRLVADEEAALIRLLAELRATKTLRRDIPYSPDLFDDICGLIASGASLTAICRLPMFPAYATVTRWLTDQVGAAARDGAIAKYTLARAACAHLLAEEAVQLPEALGREIAAGLYTKDQAYALTNLMRVRVDTRKWAAAKLAPRDYGDKVRHEVEQVNAPLVLEGVPQAVLDEVERLLAPYFTRGDGRPVPEIARVRSRRALPVALEPGQEPET